MFIFSFSANRPYDLISTSYVCFSVLWKTPLIIFPITPFSTGIIFPFFLIDGRRPNIGNYCEIVDTPNGPTILWIHYKRLPDQVWRSVSRFEY